jgi:hypothetical protein
VQINLVTFEIEMTRCIANKKRGASRNEGIMSESTRDRYRQTIRHFTNFLGDKNVPLAEIQKSTIAMFKVDRQKKIEHSSRAVAGPVSLLMSRFCTGCLRSLSLKA